MDALELAIDAGFWRVWPRLVAEPGELRRRVRRRRGKMFQARWPRACCLAVRAGDLRITKRAFLDGIDGLNPDHWGTHRVLLDGWLLRRVCGPVRIEWPGVRLQEAGERLGYHPETLRTWLNAGVFLVRRYKVPHPQGGVRWTPYVRTNGVVDPASPRGRSPDAWWGTMWHWLSQRVPEDWEQWVEREPVWKPYRGSMRARGWVWRCPGCGGRAKLLYLPVRSAVFLAEWASRTRMLMERGDAGTERWVEAWSLAFGEDGVDALADPPMAMGCRHCHGVTHFSSGDRTGWNQLVTSLSGGLLYGRDVPWAGASGSGW